MFAAEHGQLGEQGALGGDFARLVKVGVGDVALGEREQGALQRAPCGVPCGGVVVCAGYQQQVRCAGDFGAVAAVLPFGVEHARIMGREIHAGRLGAPITA